MSPKPKSAVPAEPEPLIPPGAVSEAGAPVVGPAPAKGGAPPLIPTAAETSAAAAELPPTPTIEMLGEETPAPLAPGAAAAAPVAEPPTEVVAAEQPAAPAAAAAAAPTPTPPTKTTEPPAPAKQPEGATTKAGSFFTAIGHRLSNFRAAVARRLPACGTGVRAKGHRAAPTQETQEKVATQVGLCSPG